MIDTKELRQLAQAATPGPWQFWHGWVATNIDSDGGTVIAERPTPSGGKYQARVDGNFRFIAAANPAVINELLDRLESAESDALEQARLNGMGASREAALMAKLETAEKERDNANAAAAGVALQAETLQAERDALRAKITGMEKQEPAALVKWQVGGLAAHLIGDAKAGDLLYALPGAK